MQAYIPFWKIRKDSKLLFYGCGKSCKTCYEQLIQQGYCNLQGIVDKDYFGKKVNNILARGLEYIEQAEFDYILITILNVDVSRDVKIDLLIRGVPERKILTLFEKVKSICMDDDSLVGYLEKNYLKYRRYARKAIEYYPAIYSQLCCSCDKTSFYKIKNYLRKMKDDEKKIILIKLLFDMSLFDAECMKMLLECIKNIPWRDDSFFGLVMDTTYAIFMEPNYIYPDFFKDRKELMVDLCRYYSLSIPTTRDTVVNDKRIAIVCNCFTPQKKSDAVSMIIESYAFELARLGYEVCIFVLYSSAMTLCQSIFIEKLYANTYEGCVAYNLQDYIGHGISIQDEFNAPIGERLQRNVNKIAKFDPFVILDMSDEFFLEAACLIENYPIINFAMRGNAFSSIADVYIVGDITRIKEENEKYKVLSVEKLYELPFGMVNKPSDLSVVEYTRLEYGFKDEDFLIITVGNRINHEIDDDLIQTMCDFLEYNEDFKWLLVGQNVWRETRSFENCLKERKIINWGFENNLESLYKICNVYLNPRRTGGGISIRKAMRCSLPIVMLDNPLSDINFLLRKSHIVYGDHRDLVARIVELCKNPELYEKIRMETYDQIKDFSFENEVKMVLELCEKTFMRKGKSDA